MRLTLPTLFASALVLTAFAAAGLVVFHANGPAPPTSQSQGRSFEAGDLRSFKIVPLEKVSETSSNASIGDLNGDGYPDILLVKGRHRQLTSLIFFGDGKDHFTPGPAPPSKSTKSYSGSLADMTKSGHPDIVLSNDSPDPKLILLNDGRGDFTSAFSRRRRTSRSGDCSRPPRRQFDIAMDVPASELGPVASNEMWDEIYRRIAELVRADRSSWCSSTRGDRQSEWRTTSANSWARTPSRPPPPRLSVS